MTTAMKNMLLYGTALLMLKSISLVTLPVMTYFLSVEQIGQLELIAVTQTFFALLVSLAMHENLYRFVATSQNEQDRHTLASRLYNSTLLISLGLVLVVAVIYWLVSSFFDLHQSYFTTTQMALMASVLVIQGSIEISLAWLRLQDKAWVFFKLSLFSATLQMGLILAAISLYPEVTTVLAVGVFCSFTRLAILHIYNRFNILWLKREQLKQYLAYCLPIMLSALVAFGLNGGERWLLMQEHRLDLLAQYAIAVKFALAVGILLQPFHMWWMPKRFEYWQNSGADVTRKISEYGIVYACLLALLVTWGGKLFIDLALPSQYQLATKLISFAVVAMLFKEITEIVNIGLLKVKQTQTLFIINLLVTSLAIGGILLGSNMFTEHVLWIVCFGVCCAQLLRCWVVFIASQRSCPLPYQPCKLFLFVTLTISLVMTTWVTDDILVGGALLIIELMTLLAVSHFYRLLVLPYHRVRNALLRTGV